MGITPDSKDWTWVLQRRCPDCGFEASRATPSDVAPLVRAHTRVWASVLKRRDPGVRPDEFTWSPLEYAAHVRDVHTVMRSRVVLMLERDDPVFPNWDQDAAAIEGRYGDLDPAEVSEQLADQAEMSAVVFGAVSRSQWNRAGLRDNGTAFTVQSLSGYYLHDLAHHVHDVTGMRA